MLFQDVPQLILQIYYISQYDADSVVLSSIIFSSLSVFATILSIFEQRKLLRNQQGVLIQFKVNGLTAKHHRLQLKTKKIRRDLAILLGVDENVVEIEKPISFKFRIMLKINDVFYKDLDYKSIIDKAVSDGNLVETLQRNWNLNTQRLTVEDVKYEEIRSDAQRENTVLISVKSVSAITAMEDVEGVELPPVIPGQPTAETTTGGLNVNGDDNGTRGQLEGDRQTVD